MLNFSGVTLLSFDCYGTLIDWESGILSAIHPLLSRWRIDTPDKELLELYGRFERQAQEKTPFVNYRTVLRAVAGNYYRHFDINPKDDPSGEQFLPLYDIKESDILKTEIQVGRRVVPATFRED
ncbi:MAG: hypothetical protein BZY75_01565 [SAR202 cluster bacterium Io17-Chloro-G7]|nr:MAG: hypothetical protein BZY75_01565 [SAR202 cluster bacterium Io17-Chloro-G7]